MTKVLPINGYSVSSTIAVEDNLRAYALGDEAAVVFCEVTNTTDHFIETGRVQAVAYDRQGWITDLAEVDALCLLPRQTLALKLCLRPFGEPVSTICVNTAMEPADAPAAS